MKLIPSHSKILYEPSNPFDFTSPPIDPVQLANDMINFMRERNAVGLSAIQVGLPYNVFVMESAPAFAIFNPKIVDISNDMCKLVEGCLTYDNLWLEVERPDWVRVRFQTPYGETTTKLFGGYHARVVLHEMDHLNGKVFKWKVSPRELQKAEKKRKILQRNHGSKN